MKNILFIITVCVSLLLFGGCISEHTGETYALDTALTQQHDLAKLDSYIQNRNAKDAHLGEFAGVLYYDELNAQFPIEIIRYGDSAENLPYTIYKVAQGGYYYVFWSWAYPQEDAGDLRNKLNASASKEYMCVYFSAYIKEAKSEFAFSSLKIGTSTAEIKYSHKDNTDSSDGNSYYKSQTVDEISVVSIEDVPSCYRLILEQDFPSTG